MSHPSVEKIKLESRHLRGTLVDGLQDASTGSLSFDDQRTIKFHGSYQQDDRDLRDERRRQKLEPAHQFMVRIRAPGGVFSTSEWLALDHVATTYASHSLRVTTRQTFQLHGIIKRELKAAMQAIDASGLDTVSACGDVNRNVLGASNPLLSAVHAQVHDWTQRLSAHFRPKTQAYAEVWQDQPPAEKLEDEPLYGDAYLPRKFKIAIAVPPLNDVDVFANDVGLIAIVDDHGNLAGFNVAIGGSMGASHGIASHYPRVANVIGFVTPDQVLAICEAAVTVQRDFGDREDRKHARFKYTIDDHGSDNIQALMEVRAGVKLQPARRYHFDHNGDRFGWVEGDPARDGATLWHLTLSLPSGRIADFPDGRSLLSGMREIATIHNGHFRMTCNQNVIIAGVRPEERASIDSLVAAHGLDLENQAPTALARTSVACVALPTCALAMAESERYLPSFLKRLEPMLVNYGLRDTPILFRMSGCPNGCSRPYLAEIALVGKALGRYNLMLGGDHRGQRMNTLYRDNATETEILEALDPLLARYATERASDERFGDFLHRVGAIALPSYPTHVRVDPAEGMTD